MRFYHPHTTFYCGIDPDTRNMYPTIVNKDAEVLFHQNMRNDPRRFLKILEPYRESLVVSCESSSNWYWRAGLVRGRRH
ncbi:MAG: hypothetical protein ACQESR_00070 [Planctomycetota bacterium]